MSPHFRILWRHPDSTKIPTTDVYMCVYMCGVCVNIMCGGEKNMRYIKEVSIYIYIHNMCVCVVLMDDDDD